jgi:hypothetical protein
MKLESAQPKEQVKPGAEQSIQSVSSEIFQSLKPGDFSQINNSGKLVKDGDLLPGLTIEDSGSDSGKKPVRNLDSQIKPIIKPGDKPDGKPGPKPVNEFDSNKPDGKPEGKPGVKPIPDMGGKPEFGGKPEGKPELKPVPEMGGKPEFGGKPEGKPELKPVPEMGGKPEVDPGKPLGPWPAEKPVKNPESSENLKPGSKPQSDSILGRIHYPPGSKTPVYLKEAQASEK